MKKFCSKCGNLLDLGKKTCTTCHAFNPYFIAGFTDTPVVEQKPVIQQPVETTPVTVVAESTAKTEQPALEKMEHELKSELLKVKEETAQYKNETLYLVKEVQKELHDIEAENKLLKEKVQSLNNHAGKPVFAAQPVHQSAEWSKSFITIAAAVVVILISGFSYFGLSKSSSSSAKISPAVTSVNAVVPDSKTNAPVKPTEPAHKLLAVATLPTAKPVAAPAQPVAYTKPASNVPFSLNASRAMNDLVGKRLTGCDITINSASEIDQLSNLVLVEKLSATYLKYKCTVKIKQGSETYTASPYIYYSADGTFIKVDGTNCE